MTQDCLPERFACLSARFSFSDFPGFLLFDFFGDLSAMRRRVIRRGKVRTGIPARGTTAGDV